MLYDSEDSRVPLATLLHKLIEAKLVTVVPNRDRSRLSQNTAYANCWRRYAHLFEWLAVIDCDEFLVPKTHIRFTDFLDRFDAHGGLSVFWRIFGSSHHKAKPPGGVLANYLLRGNNCFDDGHVKTIINTRFLHPNQQAGDVHFFDLLKPSVDENYREIHHFHYNNPTHQHIQLNHYAIKSEEEYRQRMQRGWWEPNYRGMEFFERINAQCSDVLDIEILRTISRYKKIAPATAALLRGNI